MPISLLGTMSSVDWQGESDQNDNFSLICNSTISTSTQSKQSDIRGAVQLVDPCIIPIYYLHCKLYNRAPDEGNNKWKVCFP